MRVLLTAQLRIDYDTIIEEIKKEAIQCNSIVQTPPKNSLEEYIAATNAMFLKL